MEAKRRVRAAMALVKGIMRLEYHPGELIQES